MTTMPEISAGTPMSSLSMTPHPHLHVREDHLEVVARDVLEQLDDRRPGPERQPVDVGAREVIGVLERRVDQHLGVVGERRRSCGAVRTRLVPRGSGSTRRAGRT